MRSLGRRRATDVKTRDRAWRQGVTGQAVEDDGVDDVLLEAEQDVGEAERVAPPLVAKSPKMNN